MLLSVGIVIVFGVAYWLLSPFWKNVILNEEVPGATDVVINDNLSETATAPIKDNLSSMDEMMKSDFEKQTMEMEGKMMKENNAMPANGPTTISQANMIARAHEVEGIASLVKSGAEIYLRFENLKTINGPDLRIYLGAGLNADDVIDLGPIRATEGNVNYLIPAGTDINKYKNAMIWCRAFGVLFSYAQL